jgi:Ni,Fe-hydrogenase maturation factor
VQMARLLYGARPTAVAISVDGEDFGYGTTLSAPVQAAVPEVVQRIRDILAEGQTAVCSPAAAVCGRHSMGG